MERGAAVKLDRGGGRLAEVGPVFLPGEARSAAPLPLSREARRIRDGLGVPITAVPGVERHERAYLREHSAALNRVIAEGAAETAFAPLWTADELEALEGRDLPGLEAEWKARMAAHPRWAAATRAIRDRGDHAATWRDILGGDFDLRGRGAEYTRGMARFQASRWVGARTLLDLLGASDAGAGTILDVLGGDGYVWRLLEAERVAGGRGGDGGALVLTNDISPHMFYRAGLWGLPTREDAAHLSRTFLPDSLDGVLFAYGTHHVPDMFDATREALAVMKPGAAVLVHDFFDEGPAGQWFHQVVDRHSKTGHDIPHIGPLQMAVALFAAGFRDVELFETQDPFLFTSGGGAAQARELALGYLLGMYGMEESFRGRMDHFEEVVKTVLTYPEVGETPVFTDDFVYVPRRAVVARARKPPDGAPGCSEGDRATIRAVAAALRQAPDEVMRRAGAPEEVRPYWFGADGSRWGVSLERQREWLAWAETVA